MSLTNALRCEAIKTEFRKSAIIGLASPRIPGGQSVGVMETAMKIESPELSITITVGYHRSQLANRELAMKLFDLALDELVQP